MKILKKISSFLFEEDTEVYAEDELEEVVFSKESVKEKKVVKGERPVKKERVLMEKMVNPPVKKEEENKATVQQKRFQSIDLQDIQEKEKRPIPSKTEGGKREVNRKEYEFSPVISPMFGAKDEPVRTPSSEQPTILKARPKKRSASASSIISPMYGAHDVQEEEAELVSPYEEEQLIVEATQVDGKEMSLDDEENDFVKSIPLGDLLQDEENSNEDTMQISLFGEDTPVREKEDTTDYTIKE